jgi:hypothetical protein
MAPHLHVDAAHERPHDLERVVEPAGAVGDLHLALAWPPSGRQTFRSALLNATCS